MRHVAVSFFTKGELEKGVSGLIMVPFKVSRSHAHILSDERGRLGHELSIRSVYVEHP